MSNKIKEILIASKAKEKAPVKAVKKDKVPNNPIPNGQGGASKIGGTQQKDLSSQIEAARAEYHKTGKAKARVKLTKLEAQLQQIKK